MGSCCRVSIVKDNVALGKLKSVKAGDLTLLQETNQGGFVEILKKDGSLVLYTHAPGNSFQAGPGEMFTLNGETIDLKETTVQITAGEKISALKSKFCEAFCCEDALIIFEGRVLDLNETVGNSLPAGCSLDIIIK